MRLCLFNLKRTKIINHKCTSLVLLYTCALVLLFTSCARKTSEKADANGNETTSSLAAPINEDTPKTDTMTAQKAEPDMPTQTTPETPEKQVLVTVNGVDITEAEVAAAMQPELNNLRQQNSNLPPALIEQLKKQLKTRYLDRLIREQLMNEQVKALNIVITDDEVMNQIQQLIAGQPEPMTLDEFKEKSHELGINFEQMKEELRKTLSYRKLMETLWVGKIDANEADAKKFYDENPKEFQTPEQVAVSHILIKPDPNIADPNEAKAQARAKIEELLKQLKNGADFADLAKINSACPSAADGGDLGFFPRGQMTPPFEKAAFELKLGQLSDVVETEYGYHIIKATGHKDAGSLLFEKVKDSIIKYLAQQKQQEFISEYIESLKAKANIVYPEGKEPAAADAAANIPG